MKKLYSNKTFFDWIVWICVIIISICAVFTFTFYFWIFVIMVLSMARYNNLADKEIERLVKECENKDLHDMDMPPFRNIKVSDETTEKIKEIFKRKLISITTPSDAKNCGMHEGFHFGKLTNHTKT